MTTTQPSAPQPTSKLAEQADQARAHRELDVALVWINTAAQLDSPEQKRDTVSAVNARLLGVIFDAATYSEDLAIKCGNFTEVHRKWLGQMREAASALLARLNSGTSPDTKLAAAIDSVALISGHLEALHKSFVTHSYDGLYLPTPVKEIKILVETLGVIRSEAAELAPEGICTDRTVLQRLVSLNHATGNARAHVTCRALSFLTEWDSALFYTEQALRFAGELSTSPDGVYGTTADRTQLQTILGQAQTAVTAHNTHDTKRYLGEATALLTRIGGFRN
ncbi:hypothetical protein BH11CYA1_BH11CYA1_20500 [soil metagenome]